MTNQENDIVARLTVARLAVAHKQRASEGWYHTLYHDAADEIVNLRAKVRELEAELAQKLTEQRRTLGAESDELREDLYRVRDVAKTEIERLQVELSSIKASQDEPVAWLSPDGHAVSNVDARFDGTNTLGWKPLYLHPSPTPQEEAIELLEYVFNLYEDGSPCYEDPDECAVYLGTAIFIGDNEFKRIVAVLNASAPAAPKGEKE